MQTSFLLVLIYCNAEFLFSIEPLNLCFSLWFFLTILATYVTYFKAAMTDPGTIRTQIYLNQNTEESANTVKKDKKHARKPTTVMKELEKPGLA